MLATGAVLLMIAAWFNMSCMLYTPETAWFPFRTAGWFILGLPFVLGCSLGYSALFWLASRRTGRRIAWGLMLICSIIIVSAAVHSALPASHLRWVLGEEAAASSTLEYLRILDSFNDGLTYIGKVKGPTTLLETVAAHHGLKDGGSVDLRVLRSYFHNGDIQPGGDAYSDRYGFFYLSPGTQRLYFVRRTRSQ
jgi:hypothetical protein